MPPTAPLPERLTEHLGGRHDVMLVDEAAAYLRVSRRSIYRMVADGRLEAVNLGGRFARVTRASVDRLAGVKDGDQ